MSYNVNPINRMPVFKKLGASGCEEPTNQVQVIGNINVPMPMQAPNTFQAPSVPQAPAIPSTTVQNGMGAAINPLAAQLWNDPVINRLYYEEESAGIQQRKKEAEAAIDIRKKAEMEKILTAGSQKREEMRADISIKRGLKQTDIQIGQDGGIIVRCELFGSNISKKMQFRYKNSYKLKCIGKEEREILYVVFERTNGEQVGMYINTAKLEDRYINKKFNQARIAFGFSHKKELEMRCKLIYAIDIVSKELWIPQKHGWYKNMEMIGYVYPDITVWKEVEKRAL